MRVVSFLRKNSEEAQKELEASRNPEPGDAAYGLYWLATAHLHLASGEYEQAVEDVIQSLAFETKDMDTFPEALLLTARCDEEMLGVVTGPGTYTMKWGVFLVGFYSRSFATNRLDYIMAQGLTKSGEVARIENVFFGSDEDLNVKSAKPSSALKENKEYKDDTRTSTPKARDEKKASENKTDEKKTSDNKADKKASAETKKEGAK